MWVAAKLFEFETKFVGGREFFGFEEWNDEESGLFVIFFDALAVDPRGPSAEEEKFNLDFLLIHKFFEKSKNDLKNQKGFLLPV